jgi:sugar lactone lactonase YvrE
MDNAEQNPTGRFYVFDRGKITAAGPDNIVITNGPAVNADSTSIYFTDTLAQKIYHAPLARGNIGPVRPFADILSDFPHAYPDGPFVDSNGNVLTGLFNGGVVASYSLAGKLNRTYKVPAQNVTKACFGGPDLRTLYATTARKGLSEEALAAVPESGGLFARSMDSAGNANTVVAL